jgi:hypothetical protein
VTACTGNFPKAWSIIYLIVLFPFFGLICLSLVYLVLLLIGSSGLFAAMAAFAMGSDKFLASDLRNGWCVFFHAFICLSASTPQHHQHTGTSVLEGSNPNARGLEGP